MDPLSVSASIIAVLQAANTIISVCYDFRASMENSPWSLTRIIAEVKDLRSVLETLDLLAEQIDDTASLDVKRRRAFELLCEPRKGPLNTCIRELNYLEELITSSCRGKFGSKRRALMQAMGWQLKDKDAKLCLERIERCKSTLNLAITADEATLLLDIQDLTSSMNTAVHDIGTNVANLLEGIQAKELGEKHKSILQWLSPTDPWESHEAATKVHQQGTSSWFVECEEFSDWHSAERSFLWLSGFPGSGKTVLFSNAVTYLNRKLKDLSGFPRMAYFYCDFRRSESQDPINLVGSLVAQLCSQFGSFPEELAISFDHSSNGPGQKRRPTFPLLRDSFQSFATENKIILLIDALDECTGREEALGFFSDLQKTIRNTNILITSRDEADIQEALHSFTQLRIENRLSEVGQDIKSYIDNRLESDRKLHWLNSSVKDDIARLLNIKSAGMFRWVQCQIDAIATLRTVKAIRIALQELPQGLNETYENILMKVSKIDVEIVRRILLWVSFAVLPLTLREIHEAVAIEHGMDHLDEESRLSSPQDILDLCGSLVNVSDQGYVRLAHLSVKEYLLWPEIRKNSAVSAFALAPNDANHELAVSCLTYLSFKDLATGPSLSSDDYVDRTIRYPLLKDAAIGWTYHVRATTSTPELRDLVSNFFNPQSRRSFMSWVQVLNASSYFNWDFYPRHATPLYYAASFGLAETVEDLINSGVNINAPGSRFGGTALHAAALRDHIPVMKLLLDAGADPNKADWDQITPLHSAVIYGNVEVISMLLMYGASIHAVDGNGETPYDWAVNGLHFESQRLLLGLAGIKEGDTANASRVEIHRRSVAHFLGQYNPRSGLESSLVVGDKVGAAKAEPT